MKRREFLKFAGVTSGVLLLPDVLRPDGVNNKTEFKGILIDTTRCIGCRSCELACAEAHNLPEPDIDDESVFEKQRETSETRWTVVNRYNTSKGVFFRKAQCMHCNQPACASACLVKAMYKTEEGPVIWRGNKCMGCRFCMISCPFDIPKFEYNSPNPRIQKCIMCWELLEKGENPACVDACPQSALIFGKRKDLIEIARARIYAEPDRYVHYIYGEHEVGGTGVLYLSAVPFEELGLRTDMGTTPYPEYSKGFLYGVPVVLLLWPAFLVGVSYIKGEKER